MQSTVRCGLIGTVTEDERRSLLSDASLRTRRGAFTVVPDPRSRHGRRYALPFLLTCLVAALLCACNTRAAVGQWCHDQRSLLHGAFPYQYQRFHTPTGALLRWLSPRLSVSELAWALASGVQQTRPLRDREPVALDGKTGRGAARAGHSAPHLLSVSTHTTRDTRVQVRVDEKTNESPVARPLPLSAPARTGGDR